MSLIQEVQECVTAATHWVQPTDVKGLIKSMCCAFNAADSEICVCVIIKKEREREDVPHMITHLQHTRRTCEHVQYFWRILNGGLLDVTPLDGIIWVIHSILNITNVTSCDPWIQVGPDHTCILPMWQINTNKMTKLTTSSTIWEQCQ